MTAAPHGVPVVGLIVAADTVTARMVNASTGSLGLGLEVGIGICISWELGRG